MQKNDLEMNSLDDYIMTLDGMIPQDAIDMLMSEYENSDEWENYAPGKSGGDSPATTILLTKPTVLQVSPVREDIKSTLAKYIFEGFDKYHKKYSRRDQGVNYLSINELIGLRLIRYKEGQSIQNHVDKYTDPVTRVEIWPVVTFTLALNDDYSGGELHLLDGRHVYKAKPGDCVFFPANFLYPHEVKTVTRGTRYALVGWFL